MKQNSERLPERVRATVPLIVAEGKRLIRKSAHRAGETATQVARKGRRLVGTTMHQTERLARRNPWMGLGIAAGTGFVLGGLCAFVFYRIR